MSKWRIQNESPHWSKQADISHGHPTQNWFGTYHSPETDGDSPILPFDPYFHEIQWVRGQWECPPGAKRPHAQFVVILKKPAREPEARRHLKLPTEPFTPFVQYLRPAGNLDAAIVYCSKPDHRVGEPFEYGTAPSGKSLASGYSSAGQMAKDGRTLKEIADAYPSVFMRHHASLTKLVAMYDKKRSLEETPEVEIHWGITGSGKSYFIDRTYPDAYRKIRDPRWWDGYQGEDVVLFEEFNPVNEDDPRKKFPLTEMLQILDRYSYRMEIKNSTMQLKAKKFIFTSNINPTLWWEGHPQQAAFQRRVTKVFYYPTKFDRDTMTEAHKIEQAFAVQGQLKRRVRPTPDPDTLEQTPHGIRPCLRDDYLIPTDV